MEIIDRLIALTKHRNTAISFIAFSILRFLKEAIIAVEQAWNRLVLALRGEEQPLFI